MTAVTEPAMAVPEKLAAKLAQISLRQLQYWNQTGLVVPSVTDQLSPRNTVRLYGFHDLLSLLVAAQLRHRVSLQHIRRIVAQLNERGFADPLRELRFATQGNEVYFQYPDGSWSGDPSPDQVIFHQVIELEQLREKIPAMLNRDPASAGHTVRQRGVMGSKTVFAGTRIPVATVQRYLDAGYDAQAIIREYPSLTPADIEAARNSAA